MSEIPTYPDEVASHARSTPAVPKSGTTLDERGVAALERIAAALEALTGDDGKLDVLVGRLDGIEQTIREAGGQA